MPQALFVGRGSGGSVAHLSAHRRLCSCTNEAAVLKLMRPRSGPRLPRARSCAGSSASSRSAHRSCVGYVEGQWFSVAREGTDGEVEKTTNISNEKTKTKEQRRIYRPGARRQQLVRTCAVARAFVPLAAVLLVVVVMKGAQGAGEPAYALRTDFSSNLLYMPPRAVTCSCRADLCAADPGDLGKSHPVRCCCVCCSSSCFHLRSCVRGDCGQLAL